jgi:hypothetical protein
MVGVLIVPWSPAEAATSGPTVIAVHRDGAVDVSGNSTYGTVASMRVPAGNWSITATATIQATTSVLDADCELVAGSEFNESRTDPATAGAGSLGAMVLLLAHHFAKAGTVTLKCATYDWTGDVLIRDVHVTAVQVGKLTDDAGTFGSGSPSAVFGQDKTVRLFTDTAVHDLQDLTLPAGTWLVQAATWGFGNADGDRFDCSLASSSGTADQLAEDFADGGRSLALEGIVTLSSPDHVSIYCNDAESFWHVRDSAISALRVGTLKYGHFGSTAATTGNGSPTIVGAYSDDVGAVAASTSLHSIASVSLGSGSWFLTSKLSLFADAFAKTTCQLRLGGATDQGRVILDGGTTSISWLGMSLTRKLSASSNSSIACNQSANTNDVLYLHDKIFAIKAGKLTDTVLD